VVRTRSTNKFNNLIYRRRKTGDPSRAYDAWDMVLQFDDSGL